MVALSSNRQINFGSREGSHHKEVLMKLQSHSLIVLAVTLACLAPVSISAANTNLPRQELAADAGWRFLLGDPVGAEAPSFSDASWRVVDLPHDWSIESKPDKDNLSGAGGGFFPGGIGWYRKTFHASADWKGKRVSVEFDGVYRDATVYLNGHKLGTHPYGYTAFTFDLTPELSFSGANVLVVRVDNSAQPNSRWYSGSGIYRHVRVVVTEPTHVAHWGVFVTTPEATSSSAKVSIRTRVANESSDIAGVTVETTLLDNSGKAIGSAQSNLNIAPGKEDETAQEITLANPALWSPASPALCSAVSRIRKDGKIVDQVSTPFGIRSLAWSAENGLLLNGKPVKLTGASVHHDNGPLGAAAFDRAEERRVELLKAAGMNAVRTAHNPPSSAFLNACDRLGLMVLDEPFDVWKAHKVKFDYGNDFDEWWKKDVSSMVLRDRNHPSIVIWGIGNEIPELEVDRGAALAKQIADQVRALDNTRPLTLAFPGTTTKPAAQAVFSQLDVTGYNYNILPTYKKDHEELPSRIMLTTESWPSKAFPLWQISQDNPYLLGDLTWTAMDYLGESGIGAWQYGTPQMAKMAVGMEGMMAGTAMIDQMFTGMANGKDVMADMAKNNSDPNAKAMMEIFFHLYPWHAAVCGDLDLTGFRRPQSYYRDIIWNGGDRVYATVRMPEPEGKKIIAIMWATYPTLPTWSWPGQEGRELEVEVYSGTEKVRLFLNDKLIGEKPTGREQEFKAVFSVPYAPGILKAVGLRGDNVVAESVLTTAGEAARLRVTADRTTLQADGEDLSFVTVEAVDVNGKPDLRADQEVQFEISGPGVIAAVGNGDGQDPDSYQGDRRKLYQGRALVAIRTSRQTGRIKLTVRSSGLSDGSLSIDAHPARPHAELQ
jgi:beta-galactosidase